MAALVRIQKGWITVCCLLIVAGCARVEEPVPFALDPAVAVTCIAVLPARSAVDFDHTVSTAETRTLQEGVQILNVLLREQLQDTANLVFLTESQLVAIDDQSGVVDHPFLKIIAQKTGCSLVMETILSRYRHRIGGQYGAREPAAVTFSYRLYHAETGRVLCQGRFDEQQQSVMENLFSLSKARSRGLTWITAEELLREGVQEKLERCPYLVGR
ncbi:hypothetical protein [Desulfobulbus alkaliphilus]|uniref:hypothetical protein n=1 Tax=Desulfobulbus alkaliphilus TaxID=869814 RepID=UPI0019663202|nr:hypothetical protein [Desulfobulbus alkaliphilus]MBM9536972.1 hypothetical protein [Desulfobulbus alkaliphilus]